VVWLNSICLREELKEKVALLESASDARLLKSRLDVIDSKLVEITQKRGLSDNEKRDSRSELDRLNYVIITETQMMREYQNSLTLALDTLGLQLEKLPTRVRKQFDEVLKDLKYRLSKLQKEVPTYCEDENLRASTVESAKRKASDVDNLLFEYYPVDYVLRQQAGTVSRPQRVHRNLAAQFLQQWAPAQICLSVGSSCYNFWNITSSKRASQQFESRYAAGSKSRTAATRKWRLFADKMSAHGENRTIVPLHP